MGNQNSTPLNDPCASALEAYLTCVEKKNKESGGLRDGDECEDEIKAYKDCRQAHKKVKKPSQ
ncbi:hypothetical protein ACHHYP_05464 [Achlya hypogyna]|uniref:CHCH domain-containing protein n=1 Tax=Achlya hypogyna TaxID=1202772 RepID=A0A1V9YXX4_ACHHY|nr:hypothetical protein ACHHYP_05464 [Achlya hypogyna]